ncbi:MAG: ChbG/HpnK family deacetylase [Caldilineaceae bacterium]
MTDQPVTAATPGGRLHDRHCPPNPVLAWVSRGTCHLHLDDGMCHGSNRACLELHEAGIVKTGSLMTPCPWSHEMISICQQRPDLDLGVHLTLNSEWSNYRWGPLSTRDWESGLVDETGCFWPLTEITAANLNVPAAMAEMRAQVAMVDAAGIEFTHIDAHMLTAMLPDLFPHYIELGFEYRVPVLAVRGFDEESRTFNLGGRCRRRPPGGEPGGAGDAPGRRRACHPRLRPGRRRRRPRRAVRAHPARPAAGHHLFRHSRQCPRRHRDHRPAQRLLACV